MQVNQVLFKLNNTGDFMGFAEEVITKYYGILFDPELNDTYRFTVEVVEEGLPPDFYVYCFPVCRCYV